MPIIVPIEDNKVGLATATDAKFRAPDYSGSGLEALGAGVVQFGAGLEERRRRAAEAIAAAMLDDRHQNNIDDAAVKKAYVDYSDGSHEALHGDDGLLKQQGADAHAAFPVTVEKLVDNHDKSLSKFDDVQRAALAPTMNERLRNDVERAANHVRQQGAAEQKWQSLQLQKAAARDAVNHADDPELFDHHMVTGENAIRQQAKIDNLPETELAQQITDYRLGVQADAASDSSLAGTPIPANVDEALHAVPTQEDDMAAQDTRLDNADPYASLRSLVSRAPGGGTLEDANFVSTKTEIAPDIVQTRQSLARRWMRLDQRQRLADPEFANSAKMLDLIRAALLDPKIRAKIGITASPAGKYVADQILDLLEHRVLPQRILAGKHFNAHEVDLATQGAWSTDALNAMHAAAEDALNRRQAEAWDYFTKGSHPFSKEQAAGLIAAMTKENNLDPDKWQNFSEGTLSGYGLAQWDEHRRRKFEEFAQRSIVGSSFRQQLAFVKHELEDGDFRDVGRRLHQTTTPYDAGHLATMEYEISKHRETDSVTRGNYANQVFREFLRR